MVITPIMFYLFSAVLLASAAMVIAVPNPIYAVLFLILCFFNAAGLFLMMGAEFLAFILLIVYVGAVAVLFLFVVMMMDIDFREIKKHVKRYLPIGFLVALVLLSQLVLVTSAWIVDTHAITVSIASDTSVENTRALGRILYTDYFYPFQVSGLVLLVAMTGAIVLTLRERKDARRQNAGRQAEIRVSDVIELKKIPPKQGSEL